jgi:hypothetical protein
MILNPELTVATMYTKILLKKRQYGTVQARNVPSIYLPEREKCRKKFETFPFCVKVDWHGKVRNAQVARSTAANAPLSL